MKQDIKTDEKFMRQAITEAEHAFSEGEVPIGAVVVYNGMVVGRGHNMVERLGDPTAHAEMQAITAATSMIGGKYLQDCTLYVTVEPCVMCAGACFWSQVGRVVYGIDDPKRGACMVGKSLFHPRTKVSKGVLADECKALIDDFFAKLR